MLYKYAGNYSSSRQVVTLQLILLQVQNATKIRILILLNFYRFRFHVKKEAGASCLVKLFYKTFYIARVRIGV